MAGLLCPVLVGRDGEIDALTAGLNAAAAGGGSTTVVLGEAGVGKSRLLRELRALCAERAVPAMVGRAVDTAAAVPFRPLAEVLMAACRARGPVDDPDVAPFRTALARLVPDGSVPAPAEEVSPLHVAEGFLRVVRSRAGDGGCAAVLLDDLHWADPETLAVLEYLADNIAEEPVMIVVSARPDLETDAVRDLIALADRRAADLIELSRLGREQTAEMVRGCLGDEAVPAEVLEVVADRADGLPFFVEELLTGLASDGGLAREGGRWVARHGERVRPPVTFAESVRRRLAGLGSRVRDVLVDAALLGRRIDPELLATLGVADRQELDDVVRAGIERALLAVDEGAVRFRHALTRDALIGDLLPGERASRARRALDALRTARPALPGDLAETAADLAEAAGDRAEAAALLLDVSRRALARGGLTSAESALRRAARLAEGTAVHLDVTEALVETVGLTGHTEEAFPLGEVLLARLAAAPDADPHGTRRAAVHVALARAAVACTDWPLATAHLDRARAGAPDPVLTARVDALTAVVALGEYRFDDAERLAGVAVAAAERAGAPDLLCESLLVHGRCARIRDLALAERAFDRARTVARDAGLAHREARCLAELGTVDVYGSGGTERLREAAELASACGSSETEAVAEQHLAIAAWRVADADTMQMHAEAALRIARRYRLGLLLPAALILLGCAHAYRGDHAAMEAAVSEAEPLLGDDVTQRVALHAHTRAVCALTHDDLTTAAVELGLAAGIARSRRTAAIPMVAVEVLLRVVDGAEPAPLTAQMRRMGYDIHPLLSAVLLAADAVGSGRAGAAGPAAALMDRALHAMAGNGFLRAVTARLVAPRAAADGWGEPARWLADALAVFTARRLPEPAAACRRLLRDLGERPLRARPCSDLTVREREVLGLVAEGLPNRAIGERLYLSPRTVEKHVERLLAKTGSVNRAQLATYALRAAPDT
nr:LuxR family transcriptional regulator [Pseudonocardia nigra]